MAGLDIHRTLVILFTLVIDAVSAEADLNYIVASATVAILLFFLCIVIACVFYNCSAIYRSFGFERIPKHELKRRELARKMASHTSSQQYLAPIQTIDKDNVSWVQRWQDNDMEERDAVMQLGPEVPEPEYRIETTLEDSPRSSYKAVAVENGGVPEALYAVVDKGSTKRTGTSLTGNGSLHNSDIVRDSTELL